MVNNRMVISFEEPKTLNEVFDIQNVIRRLTYLQEDYSGYVVDRIIKSGHQITKINGEWFVWYDKIVLYINDNYVGKIMKEINKPYYVKN